MSVYIKGLEMPTERESFTITIKYNGLVFDAETGIQVAEAHEIPPHGRCIDADAPIEVWEVKLSDGDSCSFRNIETTVSKFLLSHLMGEVPPTIIPAELPVHHGTFAAASEKEAKRRLTGEGE